MHPSRLVSVPAITAAAAAGASIHDVTLDAFGVWCESVPEETFEIQYHLETIFFPWVRENFSPALAEKIIARSNDPLPF